MKRYCQTLKLKDNEELISSYISVHENVWPEVLQGMRQVGILDMQIYIHENLLFMIVDTPSRASPISARVSRTFAATASGYREPQR